MGYRTKFEMPGLPIGSHALLSVDGKYYLIFISIIENLYVTFTKTLVEDYPNFFELEENKDEDEDEEEAKKYLERLGYIIFNPPK